MLKMVSTQKNGRKLVMLGLDRANVDRLVGGKPIRLDGKEVGIDVGVALLFGETYMALAAELRAAGLEVPHFQEPKP
jgi:hypothetical protein